MTEDEIYQAITFNKGGINDEVNARKLAKFLALLMDQAASKGEKV